MKKFLFSILTLTLGLVLSGSDCSGPEPLPDVKVSNIAITPTAAQSVQVGKTITLSVSISPSNATNKAVTWTSDTPAFATVSASGVVTGVSAGTATIRATAKDESGKTATKTVTVTSDPEATDAGVLIAGTTWATRNVAAPGTFAATPEDYGMYYQWNHRVGWSATNPLTPTPSGATWDPIFSPASVWATANDPCPTGWHVPTHAQLLALPAAGSVWEPVNGVTGRKFGSGANTIFLPATGTRDRETGTILQEVGTWGEYWASEQFDADNGRGLLFSSGNNGATSSGQRKAYGFSVRCVKN